MCVDDILGFLEERYKETGWHFVTEIEIKEKFGELPKRELNELYLQGKITVHPTIHSYKTIKLVNHDNKAETI